MILLLEDSHTVRYLKQHNKERERSVAEGQELLKLQLNGNQRWPPQLRAKPESDHKVTMINEREQTPTDKTWLEMAKCPRGDADHRFVAFIASSPLVTKSQAESKSQVHYNRKNADAKG